jgi:hypothetical protein
LACFPSLSLGFQYASLNKIVILFSGEGDDLGMFVYVFIRSDGDLAAFDRRKLLARTAAA